MILSRTLLVTAALALAPVAVAHADEIRLIEARGISLGDTYGVAYYTVERDGLRVVATFAEGEAGAPIRVEAVLAPGQSLFFSTPREAGAAANSVVHQARRHPAVARGRRHELKTTVDLRAAPHAGAASLTSLSSSRPCGGRRS